jgi:cell wall assembly regulator SMI1
MRLDRHPHLEVEAPKPPPTEEEIAAIEGAVGEKLPSDLLEFLSVANGGKLDYTFELPTEAGPFPLCFYTLYSTRRPFPGRAPAGLVLHELEVERRLKGLRPGLLPIAADGGTSVLYVDLDPERYGRIVAYVEGLPDWDGTPEGCFVDLASSLTEFLSAVFLNTVEESKRGG